MQAVKLAIAKIDGQQGRVGWFDASKYDNGQPIAGIAAVQEFGSEKNKIPPRLGMRETFDMKKADFANTAKTISTMVMRGQMQPDNVMEAVTQAAAGAMRERISKISSPALNEKTVAARKRRLANGGKTATSGITKPLVDTGLLLGTLNSEVISK
jgi:hypothetical protein